MQRHESSHKCRQCKQEFKTKQGLEMHMAEHAEEKRRKEEEEYKCKDCGREFETKNQLQFHVSTAHDKTVEGYEVIWYTLSYHKLKKKLQV